MEILIKAASRLAQANPHSLSPNLRAGSLGGDAVTQSEGATVTMKFRSRCQRRSLSLKYEKCDLLNVTSYDEDRAAES